MVVFCAKRSGGYVNMYCFIQRWSKRICVILLLTCHHVVFPRSIHLQVSVGNKGEEKHILGTNTAFYRKLFLIRTTTLLTHLVHMGKMCCSIRSNIPFLYQHFVLDVHTLVLDVLSNPNKRST